MRTLGFESDLNGNVMAYRLPHPEFTILADPREPGKIAFHIFDRSPEGKPRRTRKHRPNEWFDLRDDWKKDVPAKFKNMVEGACNRLRDRLPKRKESKR